MTASTMPYFTSGKFGTGPKPAEFDTGWSGTPPGYVRVEALGLGASPVLELLGQADTSETGPSWLVVISDGSTDEYIGVSTLRDVLDLQARWAPVATASILSWFCEILAGDDGLDVTLARLIGRIRADEREGITDEAEAEILIARKEQRQEWMAAQDETPAGPEPEPAGAVSDQ